MRAVALVLLLLLAACEDGVPPKFLTKQELASVERIELIVVQPRNVTAIALAPSNRSFNSAMERRYRLAVQVD